MISRRWHKLNDFFHTKNRRARILEEIKSLNSIVNKKYFSEKFNVSERTIERDIKSLVDAGNNIMRISGRKGGYRLIDKE